MNLFRGVADVVERRFSRGIFRAKVTGVSGSLVFIQRPGQSAPDAQAYARLDSYGSPTADDEVLVIMLGDSFLVIGKIVR